MGQQVIVFGGSGFLGSHVADSLSDRGYKVTLFDKTPSPYIRPDQRMIVGDILDSFKVKKAIEGQEIVYHFAGLSDLDEAHAKPIATVEQNIRGSVNLLDISAESGVKRFVFASTIYVFSELGGFYRCSKQAAELYIEEYKKKYGLDFTILRYGTLYGPRADQKNSIRRYLSQGLKEGKVRFPGTGEEIREYIQVRDAAKLSVDILNEEFTNQHIIITGHHPMKTSDMLKMINEILGLKIELEYQNIHSENHYNLTPYSFAPKIGRKLVSDCYVDMGQGLLECLHEISQESKD